MAFRVDAIRANPVAGLEAAPHQSPPSGPFSLEEAEGIVLGQLKTPAKIHRSRIVQLESRALAALRAQKEHTFMTDRQGWFLRDPKTGQRWVDDWPPREMYRRPALIRLGIRHRSP